MGELPISLCVIAKDEEHDIVDCLKSASPFVKEMIVVDTGSSDNTKTVAKSLGAKIVDAKWEDNFSKTRNLALTHAVQPWILVLDADERLRVPSETYLKDLTKSKKIAAVKATVNELSESGNTKLFLSTRLFLNSSDIFYERTVFENVDKSLLKYCESNPMSIVDSEINIIHFGSSQQRVQKRGTMHLDLIKEARKQDPENLAYYLAEYQELGKMGETKQRNMALRQAYKQIFKLSRQQIFAIHFAPIIVTDYVEHFIIEGKFEDGKLAMEWGQRHFPQDCTLLYLHALLDLGLGNLNEAEQGFKACQKLNIRPQYYPMQPGISSWLSLVGLAAVAVAKNDPVAAEEYLLESLEVNPQYTEAKHKLVDAYSRSANFPAAIQLCIDMTNENPNDTWALISGAKLMGHVGMKDKAAMLLRRVLRAEPEHAEALQLITWLQQ
jgi:tetratricopeptide (TPR) repeat protein